MSGPMSLEVLRHLLGARIALDYCIVVLLFDCRVELHTFVVHFLFYNYIT